jgi:hypothetical protein
MDRNLGYIPYTLGQFSSTFSRKSGVQGGFLSLPR